MANDFSSDANCKALWNLDNGALPTDSKGTNTLVNTGVTADTGDFQQGDASGLFVATDTDYQTITDTNLDAGFPLKNGDTNKKISVACWVKFTSVPVSSQFNCLLSKWNSSATKRSFGLFNRSSGGVARFSILLGTPGGAGTEIIDDSSMTPIADRWYHVAATFQDSDKSYRIRIWDDVALSTTETTGTSTNHMNVGSAAFLLGNTSDGDFFLDAKLDEVVVFDDILTPDEIDDIKDGVYGALPEITKTFTADANISQDNVLKTFTTQANISKDNETKTFTADANIKATKHFTTDANIAKDDETKTFTADVNIHKADIIKTFTADVSIWTAELLSADANLSKDDVLKTFTAQANISQDDILSTLVIDAHIRAPLDDSVAFVLPRPDAYDEDKLWDEENKSWYTPTSSVGSERAKQGGGRYHRQLVVISDQGEIYIGDL